MNRNEYLAHLNVEVQTLDVWLEREWLVPAHGDPMHEASELIFSDIDLARGRLIQDLKASFGVNNEGVDVILHLLDQLHGFRRAFEDLNADLKSRRSEISN